MFERTTTDTTLMIRHIPESNPALFQLARLRDGKTADPVSLPSPHGFPVESRPNSDLMRELQWYLETFLDYPFLPETDHAGRVLKALKGWGEQTRPAHSAKVRRRPGYAIVEVLRWTYPASGHGSPAHALWGQSARRGAPENRVPPRYCYANSRNFKANDMPGA